MYRVVLCMTAAVLVGTAAAAADDASLCGQGTSDEALAACSRVLALNSKDAGAYFSRGSVYNAKGDYVHAIADINQAIHIDPKYAAAYISRGYAYRQKGDYDRAIADLDQAIRLDPKYGVAYLGRGLAYSDKGDYDHAVADLDQALRSDPKNAAIYRSRGSAFFSKGDYDRAISDFDQAIRFDPKNAGAYVSRGLAYAVKKEHEQAMSDYNAAIRVDPTYAPAYLALGGAYLFQVDYDRGIAGLTQATRIMNNPDHAIVGDQGMKLDPSLDDARRVRERVQVQLAKRAYPGMQASAPSGAVAAPLDVALVGHRIALVVGMSAYASVPRLRNPVGDARAIADAFRRLGFDEVIEREDLTRARLDETLKEFGDKAAEADWAVIYYAGHGVEVNGENYLIPVDATLTRADHVEDEAVTLKRVLSKAEKARQMRLVILDACRSNPFQMASADGRVRALSRGLSPIEPGRGVLVAYAARHGTTADDGDSEHSPFTQALLANLEKPGLELSLMFRKIRDQVVARTNNTQEPFTYGSLPGEELYFRQATAR